jgi:hypothetical protein
MNLKKKKAKNSDFYYYDGKYKLYYSYLSLYSVIFIAVHNQICRQFEVRWVYSHLPKINLRVKYKVKDKYVHTYSEYTYRVYSYTSLWIYFSTRPPPIISSSCTPGFATANMSIFQTLTQIHILLWPHPTAGGNDFIKLAFVLCEKAFMQISAVLALWFLRRRIIYKYMLNSFTYCGVTRPLRVTILINLNLYYVSTLSCKFKLFLLGSS